MQKFVYWALNTLHRKMIQNVYLSPAIGEYFGTARSVFHCFSCFHHYKWYFVSVAKCLTIHTLGILRHWRACLRTHKTTSLDALGNRKRILNNKSYDRQWPEIAMKLCISFLTVICVILVQQEYKSYFFWATV